MRFAAALRVVVCSGAATFAVLMAVTGSAEARVALRPCRVGGVARGVSCGRVSARLDPYGRVRGRLRLFVARFAPHGDRDGTVVALAGGPGQSGVDFIAGFAQTLAPVLRHRALVVFDQRGIGRSGSLRCRALRRRLTASAITGCARSLGPRQGLYSTQDSVADLETIRRALGLRRISLYGISYGTFLALSYARTYPQHVEHLVLDSVVLPDGDPPLSLNRVAAMRRVLGLLCKAQCPALSPLDDVSQLLTRLRDAPVRFGAGSKKPLFTSEIGGDIVYGSLLESDLFAQLRSLLPAALHLAAGGTVAALARLSNFTGAYALGDSGGGTDALYLATSCDDIRFPWSSTDPPAVRAQKIDQSVAALPDAGVAPFDRATLRDNSLIDQCSSWPAAGDSPARPPAPPTTIPTLVLSGAYDLRTPLENATALAAQIPGATLLLAPTGHDVLDGAACARTALEAFFADHAIGGCPSSSLQIPIDPLPPASLGALPASAGLSGAAGEMVTAIVLTLRHDVGEAQLPSSVFGFSSGTQGGFIRDEHHGRLAALSDLSYVPGISLTGYLRGGHPYSQGTLSVSQNGQRVGTVVLHPAGRITGTLLSTPFRLSAVDREAINVRFGLLPVVRPSSRGSGQ